MRHRSHAEVALVRIRYVCTAHSDAPALYWRLAIWHPDMEIATTIRTIVALGWFVLAAGCDGAFPFGQTSAQTPPPELQPRVETVGAAAPAIRPELFLVPQIMRPAKTPAASAETHEPDPVTASVAPASEHPGEDLATAATATESLPAQTQPSANQAPPQEPEAPAETASTVPGGFALLGAVVPPGQLQQLTWTSSETFTGTTIPTAVLVVNGTAPGPTLCLTAAVHGDELNGIETVRRVVHDVNPEKLTGTLIAVPIVNIEAFHRNSRYLPDRRDLNRFFPGNPTGSSASRIAYSFFNKVIRHCDNLVDLHTGSFHRTNLPQLRADLSNPGVVELTQGFDATVTLHSKGTTGTLRRAAVDIGIPAVTLEAGAPMQVQDDEVKHAVKSIHTLLNKLDMYEKRTIWGSPEPVYYTSRWVRADNGGILFGEAKLGKRVKVGDVLGTITDPISNQQTAIVSPFKGRVLGMAMDQFVMPGFATFHIGIESDVDDATQEDEDPVLDHALAEYEPERNQFE